MTDQHTATSHATSHARVSALTDVGRMREHNEDALLVADLGSPEALEFATSADDVTARAVERTFDLSGAGVLLIVADGLGGAAAGEVASHLAARVAHEALRRAFAGAELPATRDPVAVAAMLRDAVLAANAAVHRLGSERTELHGMASTITAAFLRGDGVTVAQVGDSRAYVIRGADARQITKDQSLVQRLVDAGEMTPEQAETSMRRNIILQALGPESSVRVDVTRQTLCRGDVVLLCSDGLSGQVRAGELGQMAARTPDPGALCAALVAAANASGGPDNITVIAARVSGDAFAAAPGGDVDTPAATADCEDVAPHRVRLEGDDVAGPMATTAEMPTPTVAAPGAALAAVATPARAAPGISRGELAERRGRVLGVYALLGAAAVAAAAWTWWAFAR
ncbi:MAG TPA: protein phosphatase 2C domain-containing protein [Gemmatirosa sp.]